MFGSGYSSRTDRRLSPTRTDGKRARASFNNSQLAHVWASGVQSAGQSSNGNAYFRDRTLYSYGTHFVTGVRGDGVAFLNASSYSPSTSGHQSDAAAAVRHLPTFHVADLTKAADDIVRILDGRADKAAARAALARHAIALDDAKRLAPGQYRWSAERDESAESAGAYLAKLAKLPAATFPKLAREARAAKARDEIAAAKELRDAAERRALRLADMSDRDFRDMLARFGTEYSDSQFKSLATELYRARPLFLHAKRGPFASKARLATIRERLATARREVERFESMRDIRRRAFQLRHAVAVLKGWRDAPTPADRVTWRELEKLRNEAAYLAKFGRLASLRANATDLAELTRAGMAAVERENNRLRELERINAAKRDEERRQLWLAGERVGSIRFDAPTGGAALRIVGDELETSHGASVPLAHAIKAFRFVKLCRERGTSWQRNGRTIRVGHFQVDRIESSGDFVAGCHSFTWTEVERVARIAGVFDCPADDAAVETSH